MEAGSVNVMNCCRNAAKRLVVRARDGVFRVSANAVRFNGDAAKDQAQQEPILV